MDAGEVRSLTRGSVLAALALVGLAPSARAVGGEGLYVWGEAIAIVDGRPDLQSDHAGQLDLLTFCENRQVRRLYVAADPNTWNESSLHDFLRSARQRGIGVYAVPPGDSQDDWIRPFRRRGRCDHGVVLRWLDAVLRVGAEDPRARFLGVQLDIEPHAARGAWRPWGGRRVWVEAGGGSLGDARNARLAAEFLDLIDAVRARLDASPVVMRLAVTIPSWYDADDGAWSFVLSHRGVTQVLARHVQDRADFVSVMNYVDGSGPDGPAEALRAISGEVAYGPVESLFETAPPGRRRRSPNPNETLYEEGETRYRELCAILEAGLASTGRFLGCAAHAYRRAIGSGTARWPRAAPDPPAPRANAGALGGGPENLKN